MPNLAHIHLLLNHVPVLGSVFILATALLAVRRRSEELWRLTYYVAIAIGLAAIAVYFTGEPAEELVEHLPGVTEAKIEQHEDLAVAGLVATEILAVLCGAALQALRKYRALPARLNRLVIAIAVANLVLMGMIANLGGKIRHTEIEGRTSPPGAASDIKEPR